MSEDKERFAQDPSPTSEVDMVEEEIDETLEETFPASDPPSWTLGTDHRQEPKSEPAVKEPPAGETAQEE
jgi:hypothetical protein